MKIMKVSTLALAAFSWLLLGVSCSSKKQVVSVPAVSPALSVDYSALVPGEWTIFKVDGAIVTGDERPYITFDPAQSRFYGSNGCNTINGDYVLGKTSLQFKNVISTMRACADAPFEYAINQALDKVSDYAVARNGHEFYMSLTSPAGEALMVLRKHNMDFLNGSWSVVALNGKAPDLQDDEAMQLVIDIPELKLHGNTGCNILNGNLLIDPDKTNAVQFHDVATTRMACRNYQQETSFLLALEAVDAATSMGDDTVALLNDEGKTVMTLKRIEQNR